MQILTIIGIVLLSLLAVMVFLLIVISFIPVHVYFSSSNDGDILLKIRILFFKLQILPKSKKNNKKEKSEKSKPKDKDEEHEKKSAFEKIKTVIGPLKLLIDRAIWLIRHIRIDNFRLSCISADEDAAEAALDYGRTCAILYPLLGVMRANMKFSDDDVNIVIRCDFERTESFFELDTAVHLRIGYALIASIVFAFKYLKQQIRNNN